MLRGEFRRADGLVIPNNITTVGVQTLFAAALRNVGPEFWVGLCSAVYQPDLVIEDLTEPTLATNGYARFAVARNNLGWPSDGVVNGEVYYESLQLVWEASGGPFDQPITRMFICGTEDGLTGPVYCLSSALPAEFLIGPDTDDVDRTFVYRLYAR